MTFDAIWFKTTLPKVVIDSFLKESELFDNQTASLKEDVDLEVRDSKIAWVSSNHWIAGFCYHYVLQANESNFGYDIKPFGDRYLQYTSYSEGEHYNWHVDTIKKEDSIRKLSFSLQLSDPEDYSGGELQFIDEGDKLFFAPKDRGTIIIFDSRIKHRVMKVRSGCRKSLVGWVEGPKWK
jgi:PKHD-type hydroxylase|tara:strand:- start:440 stop:979 length:540 start_codon:yes stop_codon:yes gene_type:complete